jgi:hypothetical protein
MTTATVATVATVETTARARFFSGWGVETLPVRVSAEGVWVWDGVAGHYTACHALSRRAERRIMRRHGL